MTCNIKCDALRHHNGVDERHWEITTDNRLLPCCYFAQAWTYHNSSKNDTSEVRMWEKDQVLLTYTEENPEWNDITKRSIDDIIADDMYQNYIYHDGWNSNNPPPLCKLECSVEEE